MDTIESLSDRIFEIFDKNQNGTIDFSELSSGISTFINGNVKQTAECNFFFLKLKYLWILLFFFNQPVIFKMIDRNGDGKVEKEEFLNFFFNYFKGQAKLGGYKLTQTRWKSQKQYFEKMFDVADMDKNGNIDFNEFLKVCFWFSFLI